MATMAERKEMNCPRFKQVDLSLIYDLFDAFLEMAYLNKKVPDFSKEMVTDESGKLSFVPREEDFESLFDKYVKGAASDEEKNVVGCILNWIWTLGINGRKTTCGEFGVALGIEEKGKAFEMGKEGLWGIGLAATAKKNDLPLLALILQQNCLPCRQAKTLEEVHERLERTALKCGQKQKYANASIRNGILHFANPNTYIHTYLVSDKLAFVSARCNEHMSKAQKKERFAGNPPFYKNKEYLALYTDEILCEVFDELTQRECNRDMEYCAILEKYVYPPKEPKTSKSKKAK